MCRSYLNKLIENRQDKLGEILRLFKVITNDLNDAYFQFLQLYKTYVCLSTTVFYSYPKFAMQYHIDNGSNSESHKHELIKLSLIKQDISIMITIRCARKRKFLIISFLTSYNTVFTPHYFSLSCCVFCSSSEVRRTRKQRFPVIGLLLQMSIQSS